MPRSDSLGKFEQALEEAVAAGDWDRVNRARERLVKLLLDAVASGSAADLTRIERSLSRAYAMTILQHGVDPVPTPSATAWMMKAEAHAAHVAGQIRPEAPSDSDDVQVLAVRDRIVLELAKGNRRRLSNQELAERCKAAPETIARLMPRLRNQGLVETWKAGPKRLSELTHAGRAEARNLQAREGGLQIANEDKARTYVAASESLLAAADIGKSITQYYKISRSLLKLREDENLLAGKALPTNERMDDPLPPPPTRNFDVYLQRNPVERRDGVQVGGKRMQGHAR